jgi:3-oxoacyl-[acyl-carrier-protein] synthase III
MNCKIEKIEYYLPENIYTNNDIQKQKPEWNSEKVETKVGIKQRHISAENETALDMAEKAATKLLNGLNNKFDIDFLLLCTQSPDYYLPTSACILQSRLGLKNTTGALDFSLGCSGYIYGLAISKGLIQANIANNVLLVTSETYSKYINKNDVGLRSIFGDASAATLIIKSEENNIKEFIVGSDGREEYSNNLIVPNGGSRNKYDINSVEKIDNSGNKYSNNNLYMNGPEIFNFTIEQVPPLVKDTLKKNNITMDEIDFVVFHQANKYMLEYLRKKLNIPNEKFYINLENVGNTVSSTIPIALKDCIETKKIKKGDKILLCGFGVGYSWGATIIQY